MQPQRHVAVPHPAGERRPQAQRPVDPTKPGDCVGKDWIDNYMFGVQPEKIFQPDVVTSWLAGVPHKNGLI